MKLEDIPEDVLENCRERGHSDEDIELMSPRQLFVEYCEWEGLISWGNKLWNIVSKLNK